jgi:putative ABC transport system permease protein
MNWFETLRSGLEAILSHRLRSFLTILGILIGIGAVIVTVGFGEGATANINAEINALGSNLLIVSGGSSTTGFVRGGFGSAATLTYGNATALADKTDCPDISAVAPQTESAGMSLSTGSEQWTTDVYGTTPSWLSVRDRSVVLGSFFTQAEIKGDENVMVLGQDTAEELHLYDPVGETVEVGPDDIPFTVIGVLNSVGSSSTSEDEDDMALVPITTAQEELTGSTGVTNIYLEAASQSALGAAYYEADDELLALHGVTNAEDADFTITPQTSIDQTEKSADQTLAFLLGGIAAISLLVGGIGVANIMLVSVTERIREIGLRKALGAHPGAIMRQFLVEASVLGFVGGLIGAGLGIAADVIIPKVSSETVVISGTWTFIAILVALLVGFVAGVLPAVRAARLAPIDALRSE